MSRPPLAGGLRLGLAALVLALGASAAPAQAQAPPARIVGGSPSQITSTPWQVALAYNDAFYQGTRRERFACGGVLVAPRIVLTAAHCVHNRPVPGGFNAADRFEVFTGKTNLSGGSGQVIDVSGVRYLAAGPGGAPVLEARNGPDQGPNLYDPNTFAWDLAVLTLKSASNATPIQIAGADEIPTWSPGRSALISGWGSISPTDPTQLPNHLRAAGVSMVADATCARVWDLFSSLDRVCAGAAEGGRGTCQGDSGGPLVVAVEAGNTVAARLVGITSYGALACGTAGAPTMFVRIATDPIRTALAGGISPPIYGAGARPLEPPRVKIAKHPRRRSGQRRARFRFKASEPVFYECNLDRRGWKGCPPKFVKRVGRGRHRMKVRGFDALGQVDATPAHFRWKVKRKRHRGR